MVVPYRLPGLIFILLVAMLVAAQETQPLIPRPVQVIAVDDLILFGDYYTGTDNPASSQSVVLLLHMLGSNRESWLPLIKALLDAGYRVLSVDLRGHGDTGGEINWSLASTDISTWLDWLREQTGVLPDSISIVGASIGANLALIGCAKDRECVTAIALSPGLDYYGLKPRPHFVGDLSNRSALLVASQIDTYSADTVKAMVSSAVGDVGARIFAGNAHGTNMLRSETMGQPLITMIVEWLNEHVSVRD